MSEKYETIHEWKCVVCGQKCIAKDNPTMSFPQWEDGHICKFEEVVYYIIGGFTNDSYTNVEVIYIANNKTELLHIIKLLEVYEEADTDEARHKALDELRDNGILTTKFYNDEVDGIVDPKFEQLETMTIVEGRRLHKEGDDWV